MRARMAGSIGIVALLCNWYGIAGAGEGASAGTPQQLAARPSGPMTMIPHAPTAPQAETPTNGAKPEQASQAKPEQASQATSTMAVQRALSRLGYDPGPVDGLMGSKTRGAIAAYEEDKGWEASGRISQRLQDRLVADLATPTTSEPSVRPVAAAAPSSPAAQTQPPPYSPAPYIMGTTDRMPMTSPRRMAAFAEESRRVAEAERRGPVENAVIEFFNAMRDMSVFVVRSFTGSDAPAATEVAESK